jgi:hypothetical protein
MSNDYDTHNYIHTDMSEQAILSLNYPIFHEVVRCFYSWYFRRKRRKVDMLLYHLIPVLVVCRFGPADNIC